MDNIWVVGKWRDEVWEFQGVFDSVEKAESACKSRFHHVMGAVLNKELPEEFLGELGYHPIK